MASRNRELNMEAVQKLKDTVGLDPEESDAVSYEIFDLEDFASVRSFAADFVAKHDRLDYYFANAGQGAFGAQPLTVDGYERIFQVNYVAQFLLLELLLPLLRQSQPSRVIMTASSSNSLACGSLGLGNDCFGDDGEALAKMPFDEAGLEAVGNQFSCPPVYGTYPITKYLMTQLARKVAEREADAGNAVYAYAFAPGNINTNLNPYASCCVGPIDNFGESCPYELPYVGPKNADGSPNPPDPPPVTSFWTSPAHGTMAALYVALKADPTKDADTVGQFHATYWECEADKGYFPQGITPDVRSEIYNLSKKWAGLSDGVDDIDIDDGNGADAGDNDTTVDDSSMPEDSEPPTSTSGGGILLLRPLVPAVALQAGLGLALIMLQ